MNLGSNADERTHSLKKNKNNKGTIDRKLPAGTTRAQPCNN